MLPEVLGGFLWRRWGFVPVYQNVEMDFPLVGFFPEGHSLTFRLGFWLDLDCPHGLPPRSFARDSLLLGNCECSFLQDTPPLWAVCGDFAFPLVFLLISPHWMSGHWFVNRKVGGVPPVWADGFFLLWFYSPIYLFLCSHFLSVETLLWPLGPGDRLHKGFARDYPLFQCWYSGLFILGFCSPICLCFQPFQGVGPLI